MAVRSAKFISTRHQPYSSLPPLNETGHRHGQRDLPAESGSKRTRVKAFLSSYLSSLLHLGLARHLARLSLTTFSLRLARREFLGHRSNCLLTTHHTVCTSFVLLRYRHRYTTPSRNIRHSDFALSFLTLSSSNFIFPRYRPIHSTSNMVNYTTNPQHSALLLLLQHIHFKPEDPSILQILSLLYGQGASFAWVNQQQQQNLTSVTTEAERQALNGIFNDVMGAMDARSAWRQSNLDQHFIIHDIRHSRRRGINCVVLALPQIAQKRASCLRAEI